MYFDVTDCTYFLLQVYNYLKIWDYNTLNLLGLTQSNWEGVVKLTQEILDVFLSTKLCLSNILKN